MDYPLYSSAFSYSRCLHKSLDNPVWLGMKPKLWRSPAIHFASFPHHNGEWRVSCSNLEGVEALVHRRFNYPLKYQFDKEEAPIRSLATCCTEDPCCKVDQGYEDHELLAAAWNQAPFREQT